MSTAALSVYFIVLAVLSLTGLHRLLAALASRRYRAPKAALRSEPAPYVLVQLPLYNELFVVERLLKRVAQLEYPAGRWCIQVLDDSTDSTRGVVDRLVGALSQGGTPIEVVRRPKREGFKAGALAYGLEQRPEAEAVAIFDSDFLPSPDFLAQTVPILFDAVDTGVVQARWGHINRDASLLTRAQAVFLDGHFAVEHAARSVLGHPFNFNGTAGVWRRSAIEDAGGWQGDTITEDLDLSYRAQLAGWRFVYANDVVAPAELPESWSAFRAQQARWTKGGVETARKLLGRVLRSDLLRSQARLDAAIHLTSNVAYLLMAVLALLLPSVLVMREELGWRVPGGRPLLSVLDMSMLAAGTLAMVVFYVVALRRTGAWRLGRLGDIAFALCLGAGMSVSNGLEVLRGLRSSGSEFVRTPKKGTSAGSKAAYRARSAFVVIGVELAFAAYFAAAIVYAMTWRVWVALPFLALYFFGFATVGIRTGLEALDRRRSARAPSPIDVSAFETRQG